MRNDLFEVGFVIDASGSMYHLTDDTIGGFNSVIEAQKKQPGEVKVTTCLFDSKIVLLHDHVDIQEVKPLTRDEYVTGGCTALYDAIGITVDSIGKRLASTPEEERPGKVLIVVITDGYENASSEYSLSDIKERIERQRNEYSWEFMFLGADITSMKEAKSMGFSNSYSKQYSKTSRGSETAYQAMSDVTSVLRGAALEGWSVQETACAVESVMTQVE